MLRITIPAVEQWDEQKQEFVSTKEQTLQLEHSLVSLSKWESKWCKAFLTKQEKTFEETLDYIKCMTTTQNVDSEVYHYLTNGNITQVNKYIEAPMTATYFSDDKTGKTSREQITSELIYYWMIALNIPCECQTWQRFDSQKKFAVLNFALSHQDVRCTILEALRRKCSLSSHFQC